MIVLWDCVDVFWVGVFVFVYLCCGFGDLCDVCYCLWFENVFFARFVIRGFVFARRVNLLVWY